MPKPSKQQFQMRLPNIAARIFNTPLLIEQGKFQAILSVLGPRMGFDLEFEVDPQLMAYGDIDLQHLERMAQLEGQGLTSKYIEDGGYYLVNGRTALIPVIGTLVQRGSWMGEMSGMTSYASVQRKFEAAMNDRKVQDVVLEMDTPGGEVAGAFDMADTIFNARGDKPITAVATEKAASAGYLIASAADEIVLPRTGNVGSIGVVASHYDYSRALEKKGVAVTLLYAGEKKVDGHPFGPLDERVMEEWMAEIKDVYGLFTSTVSRNLGVGEDRIRGTQAGMFMGSKAVDAGLAHRVNTLSNELINAGLRSGRSLGARLQVVQPEKEIEMSGQATLTADDITKARADGKAEAEKGVDEKLTAARAEATTSERTRVKAILTHAEAPGRETFAQHLAFNTDMTVEQAGEMLKSAPKQAAADTKSPLDKAMKDHKPGIGAEDPAPSAEAQRAEQSANLHPNNVYARRAKQADAFR